MSSSERLNPQTFVAGADLSTTGQYRFVELGSGGTITVCNAAGEAAIGVLQNKPGSGQAGNVACVGSRTKVIAGAGVTAGAKVTTDNQGRAVTAASGNHVHGTACSTADAAGDVIEVLLHSAHILA